MPQSNGATALLGPRAPSLRTYNLDQDQVSRVREAVHNLLMADRFGGLPNHEVAQRITDAVVSSLSLT